MEFQGAARASTTCPPKSAGPRLLCGLLLAPKCTLKRKNFLVRLTHTTRNTICPRSHNSHIRNAWCALLCQVKQVNLGEGVPYLVSCVGWCVCLCECVVGRNSSPSHPPQLLSSSSLASPPSPLLVSSTSSYLPRRVGLLSALLTHCKGLTESGGTGDIWQTGKRRCSIFMHRPFPGHFRHEIQKL